ncbi:MAG: hypothetical protein BGO43_14115 [Gammaproteobacteria bacterium 39-13]|nr:2OG-Fe(II) oxygenase [Gammaproteobacteria bacterium]OJV89821.1 MAG: hypothetical protein BGO43_14115 [Gammaproteobacteria bacterium 39-13]
MDSPSTEISITKILPDIPGINNIPRTLDLEPFPHKHLMEFLKPDLYDDLCQLFNEVLARGILLPSDPFEPDKFKGFTYGFDAAFWQPPPDFGYPINEFYSSKWIEFFSKLFDVPLSYDISLTFHHQRFNSKPFAAHTDYCVVGMSKRFFFNKKVRQHYFDTPYFIKDETEGKRLNLSVQMRSVVGIFYLNNPPWHEVNGGETGLYDSYESFTLGNPVKKIPPISNSLLTFETTPNSFHTYLPNRAKVRNTMIFWLHTPIKQKINRFQGELPTEYSYARYTK